MTTTTSKSVPRSRLNITYRTRIDGRVVQKELPLRLLVAANFSGRGMTGPSGKAVPGRNMPMLDCRPMYAIGKSGDLESVMKLMRIGLPVPEQLTHSRTFEVEGSANVKITRGGASNVALVQLQHAEVGGKAVAGGSSTPPETKDFQGHLESFLAAEFTGSKVNNETVWAPKKADDVELSGWLEPKRQSPREPAIMYEVTGLKELRLKFDPTDFDVSLVPEGGLEQRVRVEAKLEARHVIPLLDMRSFEPERIAETVPEIRRLLVLRWLVSQGRSMIASNPILRNKCKDLLPGGDPSSAPVANADAAPLAALREAVAKLDAHDVFQLRPSAPTKSDSEEDAGDGA